MSAFASEVALGKPVIAWLAALRFTIYQEVRFGPGAADIVATLGANLVAVVELKRSLSFDVVAQAQSWKRYANWTFVAVPHAAHSDGRRLARTVCEERGIGILTVGALERNVDLWLAPHFHRGADAAKLRAALLPEHQTFAPAGTASGRRWSRFKATCAEVRRFVEAHPGARMKEILASFEHHYASDLSARGTLTRLITAGVVDGVRAEQDRRGARFYPVEKPAEPAPLPLPPSAPVDPWEALRGP